MSFGVTAPMDVATRALLVGVKSKLGLHYEYQYGYRRKGEVQMQWPEPLYPGCAVRIFLYVESLTQGYLWAMLDVQNFVRVSFNDTDGGVTYRTGDKIHREASLYDHVRKGIHFSIGVRLEGDISLRGIWNRQEYNSHDMKKMPDQQLNILIKTEKLFLTSIHFYDDQNVHTLKNGLGIKYDVTPYIMPIGSIVTVVAVYTGQTQESITVCFKLKSGEDVKVTISDVKLKVNEEFKVIILNTIHGWQVAASFLDTAHNTSMVARSYKEEYTMPIFSNNCYIKKIFGVCGPILADEIP